MLVWGIVRKRLECCQRRTRAGGLSKRDSGLGKRGGAGVASPSLLPPLPQDSCVIWGSRKEGGVWLGTWRRKKKNPWKRAQTPKLGRSRLNQPSLKSQTAFCAQDLEWGTSYVSPEFKSASRRTTSDFQPLERAIQASLPPQKRTSAHPLARRPRGGALGPARARLPLAAPSCQVLRVSSSPTKVLCDAQEGQSVDPSLAAVGVGREEGGCLKF